MTEMFGESTGAWGEGGESNDGTGSELSHTVINLPNGNFIHLNPDAWQGLFRHPEAMQVCQERAQAVVDLANSMAQVEGAEYEYVLSDDGSIIRPRWIVRPANGAAIADEKRYSTLMIAAGQVGSDPQLEPGWYTGQGDEGSGGDIEQMSPGEAAGPAGESSGEATVAEAAAEIPIVP